MESIKNLFRCSCPVTSAVDIIGDRWTLVIIKLMLIQHCHTFKDISESEERIAPNILSSRLKSMLSLDLIIKTHPPNNKKVNIYHLTEKGLSISPIVYDLMAWSNNYLRDDHTDMTTFDHLSISKLPREEAINYIQEHYTNSVASVLSEDY
jgi:DNA-binding HxlR family transcriptional regulator